jgi:DNA-directed RNA polymerase subunit beta'
MPTLLNFDEFCENLKEITTTKIYDKKKPHATGLFSEQIFGPEKNYTCQCGTYWGISGSKTVEGNIGTCADCGVDIVNSNERRKRFAKIVLPIPVVNPLFYDLVVDLGGRKVKNLLDDLMKDENSILIFDEEDQEWRVDKQDPENIDRNALVGTEAITILVKDIAEYKIETGDTKWEVVLENIDQFVINKIIVLPPDLRPASKKISKKGQVSSDKINRYYTQILTKKEAMAETPCDVRIDKNLYYNYYRQLQKDVNELYSYILEKMSKKEGLIRGNILGKRIDFSGRAVIVPDPTLSMEYCALPYLMFLELFKLKIAKKIIEFGKFKKINDAIDFIDNCIEVGNPVLFNICEEIAEDEVCLLNRQPSLHRLSLLGYKTKVTLEKIIKLHPLSCPPFNADFDGDQMAVYVPISEEAKQEVLDRLLVTRNLTNPSNGSLSTTPSQDVILGIYAVTHEIFDDLQHEVDCKGKIIKADRKLLNDCFPSDYEVIDKPCGGKEINWYLTDVNNRYSNEITAEVLDKVKFLGFKYSTLFGATLSLDECFIEGCYEKRDSLYESDDMREQLDMVSKEETIQYLRDNFKYAYMVESGARGSWDQVRQIVLTRGFISNFRGQIIEEPIKHSFINGLTPKEFFNSTYGSRKGLLDVALNTGTSGYLSRKLIFTCANLQIDKDLEDCGTIDLLTVFVDNEKKAKMLIGKWFMENDHLIKMTEYNFLGYVGKTIEVRSPIYCKSPKLCTKCYGELYEMLDTEFVGVIAAQSLGECNTQLVLRTFHTSGVAVIGDDNEDGTNDMTQQDIVADLSTVSKLLHKFPKGTNPVELASKLYACYNTSRTIHHVHFECVVSQLMWYKDTKWRLVEGRDNVVPKYLSVQTVPSNESWLMGLAFSNPKKHIIKGILNSGLYHGVMDKILCGEEI